MHDVIVKRERKSRNQGGWCLSHCRANAETTLCSPSLFITFRLNACAKWLRLQRQSKGRREDKKFPTNQKSTEKTTLPFKWGFLFYEVAFNSIKTPSDSLLHFNLKMQTIFSGFILPTTLLFLLQLFFFHFFLLCTHFQTCCSSFSIYDFLIKMFSLSYVLCSLHRYEKGKKKSMTRYWNTKKLLSLS